MIIAALALAIAALATGQASPAAAAPEPAPASPTLIERAPVPEEDVPVASRVTRPVNYVTANERDAAWTMHRFAECLVRTRRSQMLELLGTRLNSPEQARIVRDVIGRRSICLGARAMRIDNVLLRGAVAEALYRREQAGRPTGPLDRAPELVASDPGRSQAIALAQFGRCMVRNNPAAVEALIAARPGSREERSAMTRLGPGYDACLAPGQRRDQHPLLLRGSLAEAFYLHVRGLLSRPAGQPDRTP